MATRGLARKPVAEAPSPAQASAHALALVATVQSLKFEPGLYCVEIVSPPGEMTELGVVLPCIRIEFLPTTPTRPGHGALVNLNHLGWLWGSHVPAYVMVAGGCAGALLTIYCADDGMPAAAVRITNIPSSLASAATSAEQLDDGKPTTIPLSLVAHISGRGDVAAAANSWVGGPGCLIEGFSLTPLPPFRPTDIEYQAILGKDWNTPWITGGMLCGSRGLQLPIFGFRVRMTDAQPEYECIYAGRFAGGSASGPHFDGQACEVAETALEAIHVVISRRR